MDRLNRKERLVPRGLGSLLVVTVVAFLVLKGGDVLLDAVMPSTPAGPIELAQLDQVEAAAGFSPHVPFYRPEQLGAGPSRIEVDHGVVRLEWRGRLRLDLVERIGSAPEPPGAEERTVAGRRYLLWSGEGLRRARVELHGRTIDLATDLDARELGRVIASLLPFQEVR